MKCEFIPSVADSNICRKCGLTYAKHGRPRGGKRRISPAETIKLIEWYRQPRTIVQKAKELGVSSATIFNTLARHGLGNRAAK